MTQPQLQNKIRFQCEGWTSALKQTKTTTTITKKEMKKKRKNSHYRLVGPRETTHGRDQSD
jgi:hypothetical protein